MTRDSGRVGNAQCKSKLTDAKTAAALIKDGMTVAMSGFTRAGNPKAVPAALAERIRESGETCRISLVTGASVTEEIDGELARLGAIARRTPYQSNEDLRRNINSSKTEFWDVHLGEVDPQVRRGFYGPVDIGVIEACLVTEEGHIVPTTSVGNSPTVAHAAKQVIVEINESQPEALMGFHDVFMPGDPPSKRPIPLMSAGDRIGTPYIVVPSEKVVAVVVSAVKERPNKLDPVDAECNAIAGHLISFLESECKKGFLPRNLLPLQSGVGNIANSVLKGFLDSRFEGLSVYSEVIQDGVMDLMDKGKVTVASGTAFALSPERLQHFMGHLDEYRNRIILRPQEISNSAEVISRLGCIAVNTAVEVDLYGNVNSSHILGTKIINGLGGSGDFARNSFLSVFCTPSARKGGTISCVVPHVSHVDHTEHDVDIVITDQGVADLRGLSPSERAKVIIRSCSHPEHREALLEHWRSCEKGGGQYPLDLEHAFSWHVNLQKRGTMKQ